MDKLKKCSHCGVIKPLSGYCRDKNRKDKLTYQCKQCRKQWRDSRKEEKRKYDKKYYLINKTARIIQSVEWGRSNPEKRKIITKKYKQNNPEKITLYEKQRRLNNPQLRLSSSISSQIRISLRNKKHGQHWEMLVNFSLKQLIKHLEKQFTKGMTWDNYGKWEIDHIIPRCLFNFNDTHNIDFKRCWDLRNLQPLWKKDNCRKGGRYNKPLQLAFAI